MAMASACLSIMPEAAEAKRRRTGPEAQELEERLASLRHNIEAIAAFKRDTVELAGSEYGEAISRIADQHRWSLLREWLDLASMKMDLDFSGMSESDRSAEALPWIMPEAEGEAAEADRRPTWQEAQALDKRLSFLGQQVAAAAADKRFATELLAQGSVDGMFVDRAEELRRALLRAWLRLASSRSEPDFSGMSEADRAAEAERLRQEKLQEARLRLYAGDTSGCLKLEAEARILDFDPKQGGIYFNSIYFVDLTMFDHSEESPIGPMRFTNKVFKDKEIVKVTSVAVNILSVKIASSDIAFPIQVYGTVVARDCIDLKRVYLFHRDSDHCQLINSKKEGLILTGPKRGLALLADDYVETDLWVKDHQGHCREFSKGILTIRGIAGRIVGEHRCVDERVSLATRLSTVDVMYQVVECAVEATIAVEVLRGEFDGVMAAHTTSSKRMIVLYDSKVADGNCHGVIQLMRPVVSVYLKDKLIILAKTAGGNYKGLKITPRVSSGEEIVFTLGDATIRVKVAWSMIDP